MKSILKKIFVIAILIFLYVYIVAIDNIPSELVVFQGEVINFRNPLGFKIVEDDTIETVSGNSNKINEVGKTTLKVSLFEDLFVKNVDVDVLPKTKVVMVGNVAGIKLYTSGVLVVGMSEIEGLDNKMYKPYAQTGIKEGDTIIAINDSTVSSTEDLINKVNNSKGDNITVQYVQDEKTKECSITPVKTAENEYKLGFWVRDSAAGVGTVTFYEKSTKSFAALGHGITDIDTEQLINISSGEFVTTKILDITKGESGNPGKIQGTIENQKVIGSITKNTKFGIYGKVDNIANLNLNSAEEVDVALREEINIGKAYILCSLDNNKLEKYEIEITKIYKENNYNNKSMQIKITDDRLIDKTGGIIQGMSGSPIVQNGKFIGAVTHVLVNNPLEGYAVFGDIMIKQMKSVE